MKQVYVVGDKYKNAKSAKQILEAIEEYRGIGLLDVLDRKRPYNGQRWTDDGDRGKIEVKGITMRDIRDCFILALYDSRLGGAPPESIEDLPLSEMSLEAISQNLTCWIERYMGISPEI